MQQNDYLGYSVHAQTSQPFSLPRMSVRAAVIFALCGTPHGTHAQQTAESPATALDEVLVTAEKRVENVRDVPIPMTVLNADQLAATSQVLLRDYYATIPGLSLTPLPAGSQSISIRGITTGAYQNPTVGIVVDDVPYGASTQTLGSTLVPEFDPGDLDRIEVLRGPQGTLYGASSMGGLLKFVTKEPSTKGFSGRVETGISDVYNGADPGYSLRVSANIPLSNTLAVRVSEFTRQDPGYIDNVVSHIRGVNEAQAYGARLSALWRPSDDFSFRLSALYQNIKGNGTSDVHVPNPGDPQSIGLGDLQQSSIAGTGMYSRRDQAYSVILRYKLGSAELTSVTGYNIYHHRDLGDYTSAIGGAGSPTETQFGVTGASVLSADNLNKFTQEIRLSLPIGQKLECLVGGFYTHENSRSYNADYAMSPDGRIVGYWGYLDLPRRFDEYAAFTNLTYQVTDRIDVQFGGRESRVSETDAETDSGPYVAQFDAMPSSVYVYPVTNSTGNAFTYLVTPRFKVSPNLMVYARFASGYQAGGPNGFAPGIPLKYNPDTTQNYELGVKADFLDDRLSVDASLYYIGWKDIQLLLATPLYQGYYANAGTAKSQGVEFSVTSKPLNGLAISGWVSYDDAVLTQNFPPASAFVAGNSGDRLPYTSRWSGHVSLQQDFPLWNGATGFVGGAASYVGDRLTGFNGYAADGITPVPRQDFPSYTKTDLRAGVKRDSWTANIFVNNVADVRGVLTAGGGFQFPFTFDYIQPRTVGLTLTTSF